MLRRPGLWLTNGHPGETINGQYWWQPGTITSFDMYLGLNGVHAVKAQRPDMGVILRFQHDLNWWQNPAENAVNAANRVISKWEEIAELDPYIYYANEMNLHYENGDDNPNNQHLYTTPDFYRRYADWIVDIGTRIKQQVPEMKLVTPPFAYGHNEDGVPENGVPKIGWAGYDYLADAVQELFGSVLTFHGYWHQSDLRELYDAEHSSWYAFRWRRVLELFKVRYGIEATMLIDECGNFDAGSPDFTEQAVYYSQQCFADPRVDAVTFFLWLDPTNSPGNIPNSWYQQMSKEQLAHHLDTLAAYEEVDPRPPVEQPETIRLLMPNGEVRTIAVEDYLKGVVPSEMPAGWPMEALKAQAVAARSYAMYAKKYPRHGDQADLCSTTHCQAWTDIENDRTNQAIKETEGTIATYEGQVANCLYSANCGGHTENNEDVWNPPPVPYLRGVLCPDKGDRNGHGVGMCQHGAYMLADLNQDTATEIIKTYYTGVELDPPLETVPPAGNGCDCDFETTGFILGGSLIDLMGVINGITEAADRLEECKDAKA